MIHSLGEPQDYPSGMADDFGCHIDHLPLTVARIYPLWQNRSRKPPTFWVKHYGSAFDDASCHNAKKFTQIEGFLCNESLRLGLFVSIETLQRYL